MMRAKHVVIAALALLAMIAFVSAQPAAERGKTVTVTGCPYAGVMPTCIMLKGKDQTYNITSAEPRPPVGDVVIRLTGMVADKASLCLQGAVLDNIKWTATKQKCPK